MFGNFAAEMERMDILLCHMAKSWVKKCFFTLCHGK